jgi:hypothetical protein
MEATPPDCTSQPGFVTISTRIYANNERFHMSTRKPFRSIPVVLVTLLVAVFSFVSRSPQVVLAEASGDGSVVGDNIEAIVRFDAPPSNGTSECSWRAALMVSNGAKPSNGAISVRTKDGITESLYVRICDGALSGYYWLRNDAAPRAAETASQKVSRLVNMLLTKTAPPMDKMVVNVGTWFWVPEAVWKPVSVTAYIPTSVGVISVTTTATPTTLIYSPGDGNDSVSCRGPGRAWKDSYGDSAVSPCMYTYRSASHTRLSQTFPTRFAVQWKVSWRSNLGVGGPLPSIRTGINMKATVYELQALAR